MGWETHYVNTANPDLRTLKLVKQMFELHSDNSASCNGYRSLCGLIEEMEKPHLVEIKNEIKVDGNSVTLTDKSGFQ